MFPVNAKILDAGCGTGGMLAYLKRNRYLNVTGFDLSPDAILHSKKDNKIDVQLLDIFESDKVYSKETFDIIISHDILCLLHGQEDKIAFEKLISLLKPGGLLLMNLPSGHFFKGTHDVAVGITKRYSKAKLLELAGESIKIKESIYWPFFLSPLIFVVRFSQRIKLLLNRNVHVLSDVKLPPASINELFYNITRWENKVLKNKPWGSSVFVVMQKFK